MSEQIKKHPESSFWETFLWKSANKGVFMGRQGIPAKVLKKYALLICSRLKEGEDSDQISCNCRCERAKQCSSGFVEKFWRVLH